MSRIEHLALHDFPTEVLLIVFKYLDLKDLIRVSTVCKRFNSIMKDDPVWRQRGLDSLFSNLQSVNMWERSNRTLSMREKIRISYNWKHAKYKRFVKFDFRGQTKLMPRLKVIDDRLWLSRGRVISAYKRIKNRISCIEVDSSPCLSMNGHLDDICQFVYDNGVVASSGSFGIVSRSSLRLYHPAIQRSAGIPLYDLRCMAGWYKRRDDRHTIPKPYRDHNIMGFCADSGRKLFSKRAHDSDVVVMDFRDQLLVSGTCRDMDIKVWRLSSNRKHLKYQKTLSPNITNDWNLSVAFRPMADECLVGSCGHQQGPIRLYNLERGCETIVFNHAFRKGAGITDISWETPNTVLTAGYDTYIRLWDCRTGNSELSWADPFDSALYCLASDKAYTMFSGMCNHNRVQLWDKRQTASIEGYFFPTPYNLNCSIHSLAFDACCLYGGLDACVSVLDFSGHNNISRTYSRVWR